MARRGRPRKRWKALGKRCAMVGYWALCLALWGVWLQGLRAQQSTQELALGSSQMIGQVAPPWSNRGWINSKPLDVGQLRGKVVLLRFFGDNPTGAASLNNWYRTYRAQGLVVVGFYTPQPTPTDTELEPIRQMAASLGFEFPVGLDSRWETLNRYWLNRPDAEMAAVTFLIDRKGIIRYIQPDGQYERNSRNRAWRREYEKLERQIEGLLKEEEKASDTNAGEAKAQRFFGNFRPRGRL